MEYTFKIHYAKPGSAAGKHSFGCVFHRYGCRAYCDYSIGFWSDGILQISSGHSGDMQSQRSFIAYRRHGSRTARGRAYGDYSDAGHGGFFPTSPCVATSVLSRLLSKGEKGKSMLVLTAFMAGLSIEVIVRTVGRVLWRRRKNPLLDSASPRKSPEKRLATL